MRVLITGGTGLIGRQLVKELTNHGHKAVVLSRSPERRQVPGQASLVKWDPETPEGWEEWFVNLNDETNEGIRHESGKFLSTQFHPEAEPGPTDTEFIFDKFVEVLTQ